MTSSPFRRPRGSDQPRTILLADRRTSVRLEGVMWSALAEIAAEKGKTVHDLIAEIDRDYAQTNLSSAIRVYIVEFYRDALRRQRGP